MENLPAARLALGMAPSLESMAGLSPSSEGTVHAVLNLYLTSQMKRHGPSSAALASHPWLLGL